MKIVWLKENNLVIRSVSCTCGLIINSKEALDINVNHKIAKLWNGTSGANKPIHDIEMDYCPKCSKKVEFVEQVIVNKEEYSALKTYADQ